MKKDLLTKLEYSFYCMNCGNVQDEKGECKRCGSHRFRKCVTNLYGNPLLPSRFMK